MVDDAYMPAVRQATWDFLAACPQARLLLEVRTPGNGSPDFWNGLQVLAWQQGNDNGYAADLFGRHREEGVVKAVARATLT